MLYNYARYILASRFFSDFASYLSLIALSAYFYHLTHSPEVVSLFLATRVGGGMLATFVAPYLYNRFPAKALIIASDILRFGTLFLLIVNPFDHLFVLAFVVGFFLGMGNNTYMIGLNANIPKLVEAEKVMTVNSLATTFSSLGIIASGLMLAIVIATVEKFYAVFILNILLYLFSIISLNFIHFPQGISTIENSEKALTTKSLLSELRFHPTLILMLFIALIDTLGSASHNVGFPILAAKISPAHLAVFQGLFLSIWACGKMFGALLLRYMSNKLAFVKTHIERFFIVGVILMSSSFIIAFSLSQAMLVFIFFILAGVGDGVAEVSFVTRLQSTPENLRVSLFSIFTFMQTSGFALGMLLAGIAFSMWPMFDVVLVFHSIPIVLCLLIVLMSSLAARRPIEAA